MVKRGRPTKGSQLADRAEGSEAAKQRARVILQVVAGELSVVEACGELGVGESRFHQLRERFIEEGVRGLEPKMGGRPGKVLSEDQARVQELEGRVAELETELKAAEIRTRIAQVMPHLLKDPNETEPSQKPKTRERKRRRVKKKAVTSGRGGSRSTR